MASDLLIEAKLRLLMAEHQSSEPLAEAKNANAAASKKSQSPVKHDILDWKNRFLLPLKILAIP